MRPERAAASSLHKDDDLTVFLTANRIERLVLDIFQPTELAGPISVWQLTGYMPKRIARRVNGDLLHIRLKRSMLAALEAATVIAKGRKEPFDDGFTVDSHFRWPIESMQPPSR